MIRKGGFVLLGLGGLVLAWVAVTLTWGDPLTSLYTRHEQHALSRRLDTIDRHWADKPLLISAVASRAERRQREAAAFRSRAGAFRSTLSEGGPIGRIVVPRLCLRMVVVQGTSRADLEKGPGHY